MPLDRNLPFLYAAFIKSAGRLDMAMFDFVEEFLAGHISG